jgi:pheromone shutdown protein TraB
MWFAFSWIYAFFKMFYDYFRTIGYVVGGEFKVAIQEADARNVPLILGDQNIDITLERLWESLRFSEVAALFTTGAESLLKDFNSRSIVDVVESLKSREKIRRFHRFFMTEMPGIYNALVRERDIHMTKILRRCPGQKIVGVVGFAHLDGIEENWDKFIDVGNLIKVK